MIILIIAGALLLLLAAAYVVIEHQDAQRRISYQSAQSSAYEPIEHAKQQTMHRMTAERMLAEEQLMQLLRQGPRQP